MKRLTALLVALMLLAATASAELTTMREEAVNGLTVLRNHLQEQTDAQQLAVDYPTFECSDAALTAFLKENVTDPICALSAREAPAEGQDVIRGGYNASLDFDGLLSVEASVRILPAKAEKEEIALFSAIVDLNGRKLISLANLFVEPDVVVEEVVVPSMGRDLNVDLGFQLRKKNVYPASIKDIPQKDWTPYVNREE